MKQILFLILTLIVSACSTDNGRTLRHADSVMEEHPDSALTILKRIDRQTLKGSDLPYFALLYTQAQVKTDMYPTSDSLIIIAYAKYGADRRGDLGIRSNFYTGEVYFNREKYREAMRYYLTAYEESKHLHNDYWHAKAAERISDLFFIAYNYDEAERYALVSADLFNLVGRTLHHRYVLAQLATIMLNNGNYDRAYTLLDSLKSVVERESPVDSAFLGYIHLPMIDAMLKNGYVSEIKMDPMAFFKDGMSDSETIDSYILHNNVYNASNSEKLIKSDFKNAESFAHTDEDKIHLLYARYLNAKAVGDNSLAISFVDSMLYYQNAVAEDIIRESVTSAQRDFYSERSLQYENHTRELKRSLYGVSGAFLLLSIYGSVFFFLKMKVRKVESQARLEAFLSLKSSSDQIAHDKDSLELLVKEIEIKNKSMVGEIESLEKEKIEIELNHRQVVEKLFKEKWTTLDNLCDQFFSLNNSELTAKSLIKNMERELNKILSKKGFAEIVDAVDIHMGGIITDLRTQCTFLKESDINFLALLFAGFSVRAVCMFTSVKYDYFYVKKSRLIKRIQASNAPDKELFLEKIQ